MKKTFAKALTITALAGGVALAPAPALAYAPPPTEDSIVVQIGVPISVVFDPVFTPGEDVEITLTGINGATQSLATVGAVSSTSTTKVADEFGSAEVTVTLNDQASGSYELTAVGLESGATDTVTLTVASADDEDPGTETPDPDAPGTDEELATTGADPASLGLLVGGGALLIGGGSVLIARSVRKQKVKA
ncbi:hypothetical protein [Nesterenkonia ebinurensis]|uniref:hypothetical protein n=1 Tax=Nesterenkonia ebinurensis TaxID=2608252 RepID=UPI00123DD5D0|nr:hypothetical protein [Nesterenkonia ebinurensis]